MCVYIVGWCVLTGKKEKNFFLINKGKGLQITRVEKCSGLVKSRCSRHRERRNKRIKKLVTKNGYVGGSEAARGKRLRSREIGQTPAKEQENPPSSFATNISP